MKKRLVALLLSLTLVLGDSTFAFATETIEENHMVSEEETIQEEEVSEEIRAFQVDDISYKLMQYGINDSRIQGHQLTLEDDDEVVEVNETFLWLKRPVDNTQETWYLIGHHGVIKSWNMTKSDSIPAIREISVYEGYLEPKIQKEQVVLYTLQNPDTGKYDLVNGTTDEYIQISSDTEITRVDDDQPAEAPVYKAKQNSKYAVIDQDGTKVSEFIYTDIYGSYRENCATALRSDDSWDIWLADGKKAGPFVDISLVSPNYYMVKKTNGGKYALLSLKTGKLLTDYEYDEFYHQGGKGGSNVQENQDDVILLQKYCENEKEGFYKSSVLFYDDGNKPYKTDFSSKYGVDASDCIESSFLANPSSDALSGGAIGIEAYDSMGATRETTVKGWTHSEIIPAFRGFVDYKGNEIFSVEEISYDGGNWGTYNNGYVLYQSMDSIYGDNSIDLINEYGEKVHTFTSDKGVKYDSKFTIHNGYGFFYTKNNKNQDMEIIDLSTYQVVLSLKAEEGSLWIDGYDENVNIVAISNGSGVGLFSTDTGEFSGYVLDGFSLGKIISKNGKTLYEINDCEIWDENFNVLAKGDVTLTDAMKIIWCASEKNKVIIFDENGNEEQTYQYSNFSMTSYNSVQNNYQYAKDNPLKCSYNDGTSSSNYIDINGNLIDTTGYYESYSFNFGLASVKIDWSTGGIIDKTGKLLLYGEFSFPYGGGEKVENSKLILEGKDGTYYFYDFSGWATDSPEGSVEIIETIPAHQEEDVRISDGDITLKFDRDVDFNEGTGMIHIKEYDTDKEVLTYNMIKGSGIGLVLQGDSSKRDDEIILENALTALEYGRKYYVLIDDKCFADKMQSIEPKWFEGYQSKEDYFFTVGDSSSAFNEISCVAACELINKYSGFKENMTVKEYMESGDFKDKQIWSNDASTYGKLFRTTIQNYIIDKYDAPTAKETGILVLKNEKTNKAIVVFQDYDKSIMNYLSEDLLVNALNGVYKEYQEIEKKYGDYDIMLTGDRFGGVEASYIATLADRKAIVFNGISNLGIDLALKTGSAEIKNYPGINKLGTTSYYNENDWTIYKTRNINTYTNVKVKQNQAGDVYALNSLYCFEGNFHMNSAVKYYTPQTKNKRTLLSFSDSMKILEKALLSDSIDDILDPIEIALNSTWLVQGTSIKDTADNSGQVNNSQIFYTGGTETDADVFTGGERNNTFIHSGGDAVLNGKNGKDMYIIHNKPGTVVINDPSNIGAVIFNELEMAEYFYNCSKIFDGIDIKNYISIAEFVTDWKSTDDIIILSDITIDRSMVDVNNDYYIINCPNNLTVKVNKKNKTGITVKGKDNSQINLSSTNESLGKTLSTEDNQRYITVAGTGFDMELIDSQGNVYPVESEIQQATTIEGIAEITLADDNVFNIYPEESIEKVYLKEGNIDEVTFYDQQMEYEVTDEINEFQDILVDLEQSKIYYAFEESVDESENEGTENLVEANINEVERTEEVQESLDNSVIESNQKYITVTGIDFEIELIDSQGTAYPVGSETLQATTIEGAAEITLTDDNGFNIYPEENIEKIYLRGGNIDKVALYDSQTEYEVTDEISESQDILIDLKQSKVYFTFEKEIEEPENEGSENLVEAGTNEIKRFEEVQESPETEAIESNYINHTIIKGESFDMTLYNRQGEVLEHLAVDEESIFSDYIWLLRNETGYEIFVNSNVARVELEEGQFEEISICFEDSENYMITEDSFQATGIIIDYESCTLQYSDTKTEVTLSEKEPSADEPALEDIILQLPEVLVYEEGEELELEDMKVYACYSNGLIQEAEGYEVSTCDYTTGKHTIQVTYSGKIAEFEVEYLEKGTKITQIKLPDEIILKPGECKKINAIIYPQLVDESQLIYSSEDEEVVVAKNGFLYPVKEGETYVSVTDRYTGIVDKCYVKVTNKSNEKAVYNVQFDANKGKTETTSKSVEAESNYGELPTPTRSGYKFKGWYTAKSGGNKITADSIVSLAEDHTLYAQWSAEKYTVTFNANSGTVKTKNKSVTFASAYGTLPTPTRSGYKFKGWYTAKSGGSKISSTTKVNTAKNHTLYAQWAKKYTVTFNANGGSVKTKSKAVAKGYTYSTLPSPTRSKYAFKGWYTKKSGGTKITKDSKVSLTKNQTLYARWSKVSVSKGTVTKVTNLSSKQAKVTIKKISSVKGYQIEYATNKNFKSSNKTTSTSTSATLKSLSKGKTYYVRVRGYKLDSKGVKIYGSWSAAKTVKITN